MDIPWKTMDIPGTVRVGDCTVPFAVVIHIDISFSNMYCKQTFPRK